MIIFLFNIYFLVEINKSKYPNTVDNKDPVKTPILTPSIYWVLSANAKFPTNKLIVNPIPVNTDTPYILSQFELLGASANFNLIDTYENNNTPICLPKNNPDNIPRGTGANKLDNDKPTKLTPALAKAKSGIIINATYGEIACSILTSKEKSLSFNL